MHTCPRLESWLGDGAFGRNVFIRGMTILALFVIYQITRRPLKMYVQSHAQKPENAANLLPLYRYAWIGVGFIIALASLAGHLVSIGLSAAFVGIVLGWSRQAPVTGIAARIMIILKRPFQIGDRVIINNIALFQQVIYNYTCETEKILDEVNTRCTFNSDAAKAEQIEYQNGDRMCGENQRAVWGGDASSRLRASSAGS